MSSTMPFVGHKTEANPTFILYTKEATFFVLGLLADVSYRQSTENGVIPFVCHSYTSRVDGSFHLFRESPQSTQYSDAVMLLLTGSKSTKTYEYPTKSMCYIASYMKEHLTKGLECGWETFWLYNMP